MLGLVRICITLIHSVVNSIELSLLHITLIAITELMSGAEIMSGAKSRKCTRNQPTNRVHQYLRFYQPTPTVCKEVLHVFGDSQEKQGCLPLSTNQTNKLLISYKNETSVQIKTAFKVLYYSCVISR